MKNFFIALLLGIIIAAAGVWYYLEGQPSPPTGKAGPTMADTADSAKESTAAATARAREILDSKLELLKLRAGDIQEELARTGQVARRKAGELGETVKDVASDARITATTKARLLKDPQLSAWDISVNTTDGRVTLAGRVASPELIGRAILLVYEIEGVREVTSTLKVEGKNG